MTTNQALTANPLFGRPIWTYTRVVQGPARGPQPKLAQGSGRTGEPASPGQASPLPGFLSSNEYRPVTFEYQPLNNPVFSARVPRSIAAGTNGRDIVGTYNPHEYHSADRFLHQLRSAAEWQQLAFPPTYRNLLAWQQVQRYRVQSYARSAQLLPQSNYFLGYQVSPQVQANIGQNTYGQLGGNG